MREESHGERRPERMRKRVMMGPENEGKILSVSRETTEATGKNRSREKWRKNPFRRKSTVSLATPEKIRNAQTPRGPGGSQVPDRTNEISLIKVFNFFNK